MVSVYHVIINWSRSDHDAVDFIAETQPRLRKMIIDRYGGDGILFTAKVWSDSGTYLGTLGCFDRNGRAVYTWKTRTERERYVNRNGFTGRLYAPGEW